MPTGSLGLTGSEALLLLSNQLHRRQRLLLQLHRQLLRHQRKKHLLHQQSHHLLIPVVMITSRMYRYRKCVR